MQMNVKKGKLWLAMLVFGIVSMISVMLPGGKAFASETSDFSYEVNSDGTVTITEYFGNETVVSIPSTLDEKGVTKIGETAFSFQRGLTSVTIPSSVKDIHFAAFEGCSELERISVDSGNQVYDSRNDCNAIIETANNKLIRGCQSTNIPSTVTSIGTWAFEGSSGLTSITIPEGVKSIEDSAFMNCSGLTSISIPKNVERIGYGAFSGCIGLTSISVDAQNTVYSSPAGSNAIIAIKDKGLIQGCKNTVIPEDITYISASAFRGCSSLTNITIPESVTSIGDSAFGYCSGLTSITIPSSVVAINEFAFLGCGGLNSIIVDSQNTVYDSREQCNAIICKQNNQLMRGCNTTVIPDSVTSIAKYAFDKCRGLMNVTIPSSVKSIGQGAFYGCSGLTSITIPEGVICIEDLVFFDCSGLTSFTIPSSVKSIGEAAFERCDKLTSVAFPEGVERIERDAFFSCSGLTSIAIPSSVTSIGDYAFGGCSRLKNISVASGNTVYDSRDNCNAIIKTSSGKLIKGCENTIIPSGVTSIGGEEAFYGCSGLTSITIPSSITSIADDSFVRCDNLKIVYATMGSYAATWAAAQGYTVKPIPTDSSSDDDNPPVTPNPPAIDNPPVNPNPPADDDPASDEEEEPTAPPTDDNKPSDNPSTPSDDDTKPSTPPVKGTELISKGEECKVEVVSDDEKNPTVSFVKTTDTDSKTVKVPDSVKVGDVTYKVTSIADKAFSGNKTIKTVNVGKNVTTIGKDAFKNCKNLKSVTLESKSLKKIGAAAFSGCKNLTKITIKSTKLTKSSIDKNAFKGTNKKLVLKVPKKMLKKYKKYFESKNITVKAY